MAEPSALRGAVKHLQDPGRVGLIADDIAAAFADSLIHRGEGEHEVEERVLIVLIPLIDHEVIGIRIFGGHLFILDAVCLAAQTEIPLALRHGQMVLGGDEEFLCDAVPLQQRHVVLMLDHSDNGETAQNGEDGHHHKHLRNGEAGLFSLLSHGSTTLRVIYDAAMTRITSSSREARF